MRKGKILKYVICDVDGVLIDSEKVITTAASRALAERGIKAGLKDFMPYIGAGEEKFIVELAKKYGKEDFIDEMLERMFEFYEQTVYTELKVFPSVLGTIDELYGRGVSLAIASSDSGSSVSCSDAERTSTASASASVSVLTYSDVRSDVPTFEIGLQ